MISYRFPSLCLNSWNPYTHLHLSFFLKVALSGGGSPSTESDVKSIKVRTLPCRVSPNGSKFIYLVFRWESCQNSNSYFFHDRLNQTIYLRQNVRQCTVYFHAPLYVEFDVTLRRMKKFSFLKKNDFGIHICHCVRRFSRCWRCPGEICDYHFLFSVL